MRHPSLATHPGPRLADADPGELQQVLEALLTAYPVKRSVLRAWLVVRYAEALGRHPEFEGTDEQRCGYQRLARQWRWLAASSDRPASAPALRAAS